MIFIFLIYGLFIGSFLNVCIYRIPSGISIINPPSFCGSCGHRLNFIDMLPIINYIINRGRCRYCNEAYSIQYPIIELLNGILYFLIYIKYGFSLQSILYCLLSSILIIVTMIDYKHKIIPDRLNIALAILGVFFIILDKSSLFNRLIGLSIGLGLFLLIAILTNAMGGGDIKLMAALGLILGIEGALFISLISFIIGAIVSVILLALKIKNRKDEIPFGPFISFAAIIYVFFGNGIIVWYLNVFL